MENNKKIGKLIQEKLEALDNSPSDFVWANIAKDLEKKKKRKIAFWFFPMLISVGIGLVVFISNNFNNQTKIENTNSTNENNQLKVSKNKTNINQELVRIKKLKLLTTIDSLKNSSIINDNEKNKIAQDSTRTKSSRTSIETRKSYKKTRKLIKSTEEYDVYEVTKKYKYVVKKKKTAVKTAKAISKKTTNWSKTSNKKKSLNKKIKKATTENVAAKEIAVEKNFQSTEKTHINNITTDSKTDITKDSILNKEIKKSIKKINKVLKPFDSLKIAKEDNEVLFQNCYLSPYIGINYFNVFATNNISEKYNDNSKTGKITSTFGIYGRTMFNDKFGFRSGYGISNVEYSFAIDKTNKPLLDYSKISISENYNDAILKNIFLNDNNISLTQKITFVEMPIELYWVWKDEKFGIATAAGMSLLFEKSNYLSLKSNNISEFTIEKSNYSKNFITTTVNLEMYFTYKLYEKLNLEISPQIKYQMSGTENSGGIKPIILSFQTGLSYKLF